MNTNLEFMDIEQPQAICMAYRYNDVLHGDEFHTYVKVYLYEYPVIKETPKGIWIREWGRKRFVNLEARKKFACLSKEDALISFKARKTRQVKILEAQLKNTKEALIEAEKIDTLKERRR